MIDIPIINCDCCAECIGVYTFQTIRKQEINEPFYSLQTVTCKPLVSKCKLSFTMRFIVCVCVYVWGRVGGGGCTHIQGRLVALWFECVTNSKWKIAICQLDLFHWQSWISTETNQPKQRILLTSLWSYTFWYDNTTFLTKLWIIMDVGIYWYLQSPWYHAIHIDKVLKYEK